jgi:hypothetical protein
VSKAKAENRTVSNLVECGGGHAGVGGAAGDGGPADPPEGATMTPFELTRMPAAYRRLAGGLGGH